MEETLHDASSFGYGCPHSTAGSQSYLFLSSRHRHDSEIVERGLRSKISSGPSERTTHIGECIIAHVNHAWHDVVRVCIEHRKLYHISAYCVATVNDA